MHSTVNTLLRIVTVDSLAGWLNATIASAGTRMQRQSPPQQALYLGASPDQAGLLSAHGSARSLKRWVRGVWAELSESARERQADVLFWAIREGVPVDGLAAAL